MVGCSWYSFGLLLLRCGCEVNHGREHVVGQAKVVEHHCGRFYAVTTNFVPLQLSDEPRSLVVQ